MKSSPETTAGQASMNELLKLAKILFAVRRRMIIPVLMGLLCLVLLEQVVGYAAGIVPSNFYLVLGVSAQDRTSQALVQVIAYAGIIVVITAFIKATTYLVGSILWILWRDSLTQHLHGLYLHKHSAYRVTFVDKRADNPDQRIAQDACQVADDLSGMLIVLLVSPFTFAYYTYKCAQITGYLGPVAVLLFFAVSCLINKFVMAPVGKWTYIRDRYEGNFRYQHMLVRTNCEASAFYNGQELDRIDCDRALTSLQGVAERYTLWKFLQNCFIQFCDYSVSVLTYAIISIPIWSGKFDDLSGAELSSLISQYSFVSMYLFNCCTTLIDLSEQAATWMGTTHRVMDFLSVLETLEAPVLDSSCEEDDSARLTLQSQAMSQESPGIYEIVPYEHTEEAFVSLQTVGVCVPNTERLLIARLTYHFSAGKNVLISGGSGVGKSSLLRVIGHLWQPASGIVRVSGQLGIGYPISIIPQKPFFVSGPLSRQIHFGVNQKEIDHAVMQQILNDLDLQEVVRRYGGLHAAPEGSTWYDVLTPGEAQRLCLARVLYHRPSLLFLDEATSQIDTAMERTVYRMLADSRITCISVGHRDSIRQFHDEEIHINSDGSATITPVQEAV